MHVMDLLSLKGKVILVTGGAGNYGRSITEGLGEAGEVAFLRAFTPDMRRAGLIPAL